MRQISQADDVCILSNWVSETESFLLHLPGVHQPPGAPVMLMKWNVMALTFIAAVWHD